MATHSSVLAWRIPGTGEPGGLLSMGSNRVGRNWSDLGTAAAAEQFLKYFCNLPISFVDILKLIILGQDLNISLREHDSLRKKAW